MAVFRIIAMRKVVGFAAIAGLIMSSAVAGAASHGPACSITDKLFVCGEAKTRAEIFAAMVNPKTLEAIQSAERGDRIFETGMEREAFRRSLEKNRRAMRAHANRAFRKYRRRKMSGEDYAKVRADYELGVEHYRAALRIFREEIWFRSEPKNADASQ